MQRDVISPFARFAKRLYCCGEVAEGTALPSFEILPLRSLLGGLPRTFL